jgi:hypothetical protein
VGFIIIIIISILASCIFYIRRGIRRWRHGSGCPDPNFLPAFENPSELFKSIGKAFLVFCAFYAVLGLLITGIVEFTRAFFPYSLGAVFLAAIIIWRAGVRRIGRWISRLAAGGALWLAGNRHAGYRPALPITLERPAPAARIVPPQQASFTSHPAGPARKAQTARTAAMPTYEQWDRQLIEAFMASPEMAREAARHGADPWDPISGRMNRAAATALRELEHREAAALQAITGTSANRSR